jgi:hypothetical protein
MKGHLSKTKINMSRIQDVLDESAEEQRRGFQLGAVPCSQSAGERPSDHPRPCAAGISAWVPTNCLWERSLAVLTLFTTTILSCRMEIESEGIEKV